MIHRWSYLLGMLCIASTSVLAADTLPGKSTGNGIVFDEQGRRVIADYAEHNVLRENWQK